MTPSFPTHPQRSLIFLGNVSASLGSPRNAANQPAIKIWLYFRLSCFHFSMMSRTTTTRTSVCGWRTQAPGSQLPAPASCVSWPNAWLNQANASGRALNRLALFFQRRPPFVLFSSSFPCCCCCCCCFTALHAMPFALFGNQDGNSRIFATLHFSLPLIVHLRQDSGLSELRSHPPTFPFLLPFPFPLPFECLSRIYSSDVIFE